MLQPLDRLPLAARKDIRDNYTTVLPTLESSLSELLKKPWKISINELLVQAYANTQDESSYARTSPGSVYAQYITSFISALQYAASRLDLPVPDAEVLIADEINKLANKHVLTMEPDTDGKVSYCGCDLKDGKLRIIFQPEHLAYNIDDAGREIVDALSNACPADEISLDARIGILRDFDEKITPIREEARKVFNCTLDLTVNFSAVYKSLSESKEIDKKWWKKNLGEFTRRYFEAFVSTAKRQGFEGDDMMTEAFSDAVTEKKVGFRIVKDGEMKMSYCDVVLDGGVMYLQCKQEKFGTNIDDVANNLVNIL